MRINNNLMAMNTHRQLGQTNAAGSRSMEKLSSGFRINRAGDDAAGLSISEKMRAQVRGLNQASRNAQDGISLIQTAEGALNETQAILQRMRELAVQSANDTNVTTDRDKIQSEMNQLSKEVTRIADTTEFNTQKLVDGTFTTKQFQIGANKDQKVDLDINGMNALDLKIVGEQGMSLVNDKLSVKKDETITTAVTFEIALATGTAATTIAATRDTASGAVTVTLGKEANTGAAGSIAGAVVAASSADIQAALAAANITQVSVTAGTAGGTVTAALAATPLVNVAGDKDSGAVSVMNYTNANKAIETINNAINTVSEERSKLGAMQNRIEHTIKNLDTSAENLQASESRIRDVDMAKEMMEFTKNNILTQAAQAMLAQANQAPQGVLQLLR
ncbi:MAG: flagellin [Firmicutes bacterium HGW-Firmicutes-2]|nr:MAG: flagellin [Firmicutes bacterium HGW-Firmicutes-2]